MRLRRSIATLIATFLVSACTGTTRSGSPDDSFSIDGAKLGSIAAFFPADLLTKPTGEVTHFEPIQDSRRADSKMIGWRGGKVSATGPDGSVYTLTVPPQALGMPTEISLTPLADTEGLPFEKPPKHRLGVEFAPDGLQFATPAELVVDASEPVAAGALTLSYRAGGRYSGVVASSEEGSRITTQIDHFSGYVMVWPLTEDEYRAAARLELDYAEWSLESIFHDAMAFIRNQQSLGIEAPDLLTIAAAFLPEFEKEVLNARTNAAGRGCGETEQAIKAYVDYRRFTELLGVADDKDLNFDRPIPKKLFDLHQRLCWEEQFIRCRVTGDFKSLGEYFFRIWRQYSIMTGDEPPSDWVPKATSYLKRCGRWKVTITSLVQSIDLGDPPVDHQTYGLTSEIDLKWKAGDLSEDLGIQGSTIEGTGAVEIDKIAVSRSGCSVEISPGPVVGKPWAKLTEITFDQPEREWVNGFDGGNLNVGGYWREVRPPRPGKLDLALYIPAVGSSNRMMCPGSFDWEWPGDFKDLPNWLQDAPACICTTGADRFRRLRLPIDYDALDQGLSPYGLRFEHGWEVCGRRAPFRPCQSPPFTAKQTLDDTGNDWNGSRYRIQLDVQIEHTPG